MVRTTVGTIAEAQLSVQQSESVTTVSTDQTSTVSPSGRQKTTITAASGTLLSITGIRLLVLPPSDATSGSHGFTIDGPNGVLRFITVQSSFDKLVFVNNNIVTRGDLSQVPADPVAQQRNIQSLTIDDTTGIQINYDNDTDVSQSQTREIELIGLERSVTS
jgi:hypothetical protein